MLDGWRSVAAGLKLKVRMVGKLDGRTSAFLNIFLNSNKSSVRQKSISFMTLVQECLNSGRKVNVVVVFDKFIDGSVVNLYEDLFREYLSIEGFALVFVAPRYPRVERLLAISSFVVSSSPSLTGWSRFNFICLMAFSRMRVDYLKSLFSALPCDHWIGLSGGIELPALKSRADELSSNTCVSALQFGQASLEQKHFKDYKADLFFVYDQISELTYRALSMQVGDIVEVGSPEFEYYLRLLKQLEPGSESRLNVVFVDQPVMQRSEFTAEFMRAVVDLAERLSVDEEIEFRIKPHPRGSAFPDSVLAGFNIEADWVACMSTAHVAIGFFSNLCDVALLSGRTTFYLGAERIFQNAKLDWIESQGGVITSDIHTVEFMISEMKENRVNVLKRIKERQGNALANSADKIIRSMVNLGAAKRLH